MRRVISILSIAVIIGGLLVTNCKKKKVEMGYTKGETELPAESPLSPDELTVVTPAGETQVQSDGSFEVNTYEVPSYQLIVAFTKDSAPVLMGYITPDSMKECKLNSRSTAIALLLLNPVFALADDDVKTQFIQEAQQKAEFQELVDMIEEILKNDPENLSDYDKHPEIYNKAVEIIYSVLSEKKKGKKINILTTTSG